jgi:glycosyltransferase involved in cell wall biosynthesis
MNLKGNPKVVLVHDYLNQYGGAERTLEKIMELFPEAPIYTGILDLKKLPKEFKNRKIVTPKLNFIFQKFPKLFTFLMGNRFENFDLSDYDLIISDGTAWAKSVIFTNNQLHIAYIHTPPRFLYKYSSENTLRKKWYLKPLFAYLDFHLRMWDFAAAQRPDFLLCNSEEVSRRIKKFYKRESEVIYPPVKTVNYQESRREDFYLITGRLSSYKNFDLVVKLFNNLNQKLIIIGTGIEEENLKRLATSKNIKFLGKVSDEVLEEYYNKAKGYIFPVKDEDFGIALVEALSHGTPALVHRSGGPKEILREDVDGLFFNEVNLDSLTEKFIEFDKKLNENYFDRKNISKNTEKFDEKIFTKKLSKYIEIKWNDFFENK